MVIKFYVSQYRLCYQFSYFQRNLYFHDYSWREVDPIYSTTLTNVEYETLCETYLYANLDKLGGVDYLPEFIN
jgi:hypothetical protein